MDVLILDDWMRDPVPLTATQDLLELFDDRYAHASTIISTQVPISDWYARFPDPTLADAVLDRIVHSAYQLNLLGDSQRKLRGFRSMSHT
jgi:DNA replication protein DnaC